MIEETTRGQEGAFGSTIRLTVVTDEYERSLAGTIFSGNRPRIIQVRDIDMDFEVTPHMLFIRNSDKPGFIGQLGTVLRQYRDIQPWPRKSRWRCDLRCRGRCSRFRRGFEGCTKSSAGRPRPAACVLASRREIAARGLTKS